MNMNKKQAIGRTKRAQIITDLEADFGVIRATEKKIKKALPHHSDEAAHGLFFVLHTHYKNPTFSVYAFDSGFLIPQPASALIEMEKGKWNVLENGEYESRIDEILKILIDTFGGDNDYN